MGYAVALQEQSVNERFGVLHIRQAHITNDVEM